MTAGPKSSASQAGREIILGIDPGSLVTGWGIVEVHGNKLRCQSHGTIAASATEGLADRLHQIYSSLCAVIQQYQPTGMSLEKVFFSRNAQSALKLGQARGVALLAAAEHRLHVAEYSAAEIKVAVVGYGRATKEQVQKMVGSLLLLRGRMRADAADALAAAICHIHCEATRFQMTPDQPRALARTSWRDCIELATKR